MRFPPQADSPCRSGTGPQSFEGMTKGSAEMPAIKTGSAPHTPIRACLKVFRNQPRVSAGGLGRSQGIVPSVGGRLSLGVKTGTQRQIFLVTLREKSAYGRANWIQAVNTNMERRYLIRLSNWSRKNLAHGLVHQDTCFRYFFTFLTCN